MCRFIQVEMGRNLWFPSYRAHPYTLEDVRVGQRCHWMFLCVLPWHRMAILASIDIISVDVNIRQCLGSVFL